MGRGKELLLMAVGLPIALITLAGVLTPNVKLDWQAAKEVAAAQLAPAATPPAVDPQKAVDDGLALEAAWLRAKAGKDALAFPPDPAAIDRADRAIGEIPQDWPKAEEAVALVKRLRAERPAIGKAYRAAEAAQRAKLTAAREKDLLEKRRRAPEILETTFLDGGYDVYVKAEGKDFRTLRIKYVLMSRPLVYKIQNNWKIRETWRDLGFTKVVLTDGFHETWTMKP